MAEQTEVSVIMPELSLSSSDLALIVPDLDPEHIEEVPKIGHSSIFKQPKVSITL